MFELISVALFILYGNWHNLFISVHLETDFRSEELLHVELIFLSYYVM